MHTEKSVLRTLDVAGLTKGRSKKKKICSRLGRGVGRRTAAVFVSPVAPVTKIIVQFAEFAPFGEVTLK